MVNRLWTSERPKEAGFYWHKGANGKMSIAHIKRRGGWAVVYGDDVDLSSPCKWSVSPIRIPSLYEANKVEKTLKELTLAVTDFLVGLDGVMKEPESADRGRKIALLSNRLDVSNDAAMHFALNMPFESVHAMVKKRERLSQDTSGTRDNNDTQDSPASFTES